MRYRSDLCYLTGREYRARSTGPGLSIPDISYSLGADLINPRNRHALSFSVLSGKKQLALENFDRKFFVQHYALFLRLASVLWRH